MNGMRVFGILCLIWLIALCPFVGVIITICALIGAGNDK